MQLNHGGLVSDIKLELFSHTLTYSIPRVPLVKNHFGRIPLGKIQVGNTHDFKCANFLVSKYLQRIIIQYHITDLFDYLFFLHICKKPEIVITFLI